MTQDENNLLTNLHHWVKNQDENFTTEAFVHLLCYLRDNESENLLSILNKLTNNFISWKKSDIRRLSITTQVKTELGTPDIEIKTNTKLLYVEVKVKSEIRSDQIKRYKQLTDQKDFSHKCLVTITRYPVIHDKSCKPDNFFRWHKVSDWLSDLDQKNETTQYIINQFNQFLKDRGIAMSQVSWELTRGLKSFQSLIDMIAEGLTANKIKIYSRTAAWEWNGFYIEINSKRFLIGVNFEIPNEVIFSTEFQIENLKEKNIQSGIFEDAYWSNTLDLETEKVHFFAREKANQLLCIENFIRENYQTAKILSNE